MAEAAERLLWALEYAVWDQSATDEARSRLAAEQLLCRLHQRYASCSWHKGVAAFTLPLAAMADSSLFLLAAAHKLQQTEAVGCTACLFTERN